MARGVTTLFLDDTAVKLLVSDGRRALRWARATLDPGAVSGGVIQDETAVAGRLKKLVGLVEIRPGRIAVGLSEPNAIYRLIVLPDLPPALVQEAVAREMERAVPVPLNENYLCYQAMDTTEKGERRYFVAIFPRKSTDVLMRTLRQAGLRVGVMDLAPLALVRWVDAARAVILDVRRSSFDIIVMADRVPEVIRSLPLPAEAQSPAEKMTVLSEELERTVTFYNSSHTDKPLDATAPIYVTGDVAEAPEYWPLLAGRLENKISPMPLRLEAAAGFDQGRFMVNVGLAVKGLPPDKLSAGASMVNFNALPKVYMPQRVRPTRVLVPIFGGAGLVLAVYLGFLAQGTGAGVLELQSELAATDSLIAQQTKEIAAIKKQVEDIQAQVKAVKLMDEQVGATVAAVSAGVVGQKAQRDDLDGDLAELVQSLPPAVHLGSIGYSRDSISLSGTASQETGVFGYARNLRASGRFARVTVTSIAAEKAAEAGESAGTGYTFQLTLN